MVSKGVGDEVAVGLLAGCPELERIRRTNAAGAEFWSSRARRVYPYLFQNVPFGHSLGARLAGTHDYELGTRLVNEYFERHADRRVHLERS